MLIRVEIPIDAPGIDALLRRSFESDAEAKLVHDLREDGFLTLGLVATDDEGQVIGYVAFSPVDVQGEDLQWVGMAPWRLMKNTVDRGWHANWSMKDSIRLMSSAMPQWWRWAIRRCTVVSALNWRRITICVAAGRALKAPSRYIV